MPYLARGSVSARRFFQHAFDFAFDALPGFASAKIKLWHGFLYSAGSWFEPIRAHNLVMVNRNDDQPSARTPITAP
jgi:hypothetical protein